MFHFASWLRKLREALSQNQRPRSQRSKVRLEGQALESRIVPSASPQHVPKPAHHAHSSGSSGKTSSGYTPAQIREAYGVGLITFGSSMGTVQGTGAGQTIAILDVYDDPKIASDLAYFDQTFKLPAPPSFVKMNEYGSTKNLPRPADLNNQNQAAAMGETTLDVEWAHAIAPQANIVLIEANNDQFALQTAMQTAENLPGVSVISVSWGYDYEVPDEQSFDMYYATPTAHPGVTVFNASGDYGSPYLGTPDTAPDVVTVGGTTLNLSRGGSFISESAWSGTANGGSTGGTSTIEPEPVYQKGVQATGHRTAPDVSFDGNPNTGVDVYQTYGGSGWSVTGGTSVGAPCWAGLLAIADQGRALEGEGPLNGETQTLPALYSLPVGDFHDITSGSNGGYRAGPGYDEVTGIGSPVANRLVPDLAAMNFLPDGEVGQSYSQTITVPSGSTVSYVLTHPTSKVTPASLGLQFTVNGDELTIAGSPTSTGTLGFEVVTNTSGVLTTQLETLTVDPDLTLSPGPLALPGASIGAAYSQSITPIGGSGNISLSYKVTAPPPDLKVKNATPASVGLRFAVVGSSLVISGAPTSTGMVTFTVTAKDAYGSVSTGYTINVGVTLSPVNVLDGSVGSPYSQTIAAAGGTGSTTVSDIITSSTTPTDLGLSFTASGNTVAISGTPTAAGTIDFNVTATSGGATTISYYTLTIGAASAPTVSQQPASAAINAGDTVRLAATATDGFTPLLSVAWQVSVDGGPFTSVAAGSYYGNSADTDILTVSGAPASLNGAEYEAVFTNGVGLTATTAPATLTVDYAPTDLASPSNFTVGAGGNAAFVASASGSPAPAVHWQISTNGGRTYSYLAAGGVYGDSVTTTTLTILGATASLNGDLYRAVFSNTLLGASAASIAATSPARLTVDYAPKITRNPASLIVNDAGAAIPKASFIATAAGGNPAALTVQWQYSTGSGQPFNDVTAGGIYGSSGTTDTLAISAATADLSGYQYRAVFSNAAGLTATSSAATLTVDLPATVTSSPASQTINAGGGTSFAAAGSGFPAPGVYWQISTNGGKSYAALAKGGVYGNSVSTPTLTIANAPASLNGALYRAVFSNTLFGATKPTIVATAPARLTVEAPASIGGTKANQMDASAAALLPFSAVTVTDAGDATELQDVQVALSDGGATGALSGFTTGAYDSATGVYTLASVTLSQAQAALRSLLFTPATSGTPGVSVTTTFTITLTDAGGTATNDDTTLVVG
jgi:hypothetical protein